MSDLAFCCGRKCSDHGAAVQVPLENDTLFVYTGQGNQETSISLHLQGKVMFIFYSCISYLFLSGTWLALFPLKPHCCLVSIQMTHFEGVTICCGLRCFSHVFVLFIVNFYCKYLLVSMSLWGLHLMQSFIVPYFNSLGNSILLK